MSEFEKEKRCILLGYHVGVCMYFDLVPSKSLENLDFDQKYL